MQIHYLDNSGFCIFLENTTLIIDYYNDKSDGDRTVDSGVITEEELKKSINDVYEVCITSEIYHVPYEVYYNQEKTFQRSVDYCARKLFLKRYKNDFTFDKCPECESQCKKIQKAIRLLE